MDNDPNLNLPDPEHVKKCIDDWRKIDKKEISDFDMDKALGVFLDNLKIYPIHRKDLKQYMFFYRIRNPDNFNSDYNDCWEPPNDKCRMNRCNAQGSPVLYVSEKMETPFYELAIKPEQEVYFMKYKLIDTLSVIQVIPEQSNPINLEMNPIYEGKNLLSHQRGVSISLS